VDVYGLGVLTDGPRYSATPTTRDRERLREEVLAGLQWRTHRVWALDWVRNRNAEIARLDDQLEIDGVVVFDDDPAEDEPRHRAERLVVDLVDAIDAMHFDWVVDYESSSLPTVATNYNYEHNVNRDRQRQLIVELARAEAPFHVDYAARRLVRLWGLKRVREPLRKATVQAAKMAARAGEIELRGDFVWLPGHPPLTKVRSRNWNDPNFRGIEDVPPEEISLAYEKLGEAGVVDETELKRVVAKVLGFDRVGPNIREALERARRHSGAHG
jgi:hypothetical protein